MPILRPPHKSYSLIFDAGLPGDFAAWFIQQHDGFSRPPNLKIYDYDVGFPPTVKGQSREWTPIIRKIYYKFAERSLVRQWAQKI